MEFVALVRQASTGCDQPTRHATTTLLNALRCGVTHEQLTAVLPKVNNNRLLSAYDLLTRELASATASWEALVQSPTLETFQEHGKNASRILPAPVHRIETALTQAHRQHSLNATIAAVTSAIDSINARVQQVEDALVHSAALDQEAASARLGLTLHDVSSPGLWNHTNFLPTRVGQLSTTRAADLRGEER